MNWVWIILGILFLTYCIYKLIQYLLLPRPPNRIGPETIDISKPNQQIITSEQLMNAWASPSGSTLIFYIYPTIRDRTGQSGNEYASIVQIGTKQNLKLLVAPDAGRNGAMAPALLEIFEKGSAKPEIIELPNIHLQRWSGIAIVKQGRRFNVYINGKLSASQVCSAMPDFDSTQPLRTGDSRMSGSIALMSIAPYPMQVSQIHNLYTNSVDTEGKPYLSSGFDFIPIPSFNLDMFWCPGGNCSTPKRPAPTEEWTSPYG